jgi:hypothetical protein
MWDGRFSANVSMKYFSANVSRKYVCMYVWAIAHAGHAWAITMHGQSRTCRIHTCRIHTCQGSIAMGPNVAPKAGIELLAAVAKGMFAHWGQRKTFKGKHSFNPLCLLKGGSRPNDDYNQMKLSDLQKESAKRDARELAPTGIHDDDQSRKKQAAVADYDPHEELCEGENVPAQVPVHKNVPAQVPCAPAPAPPRVHVDSSGEGVVKVYNSYSIKDKCRAAGFQFVTAERAWIKSAAAVLEQLGVASFEDMPPDAILEMIQNTDEDSPVLSIKEDKVCVYNSYAIKNELKALGFRFIDKDKTWARALDEVLDSSLRPHTLVA